MDNFGVNLAYIYNPQYRVMKKIMIIKMMINIFLDFLFPFFAILYHSISKFIIRRN